MRVFYNVSWTGAGCWESLQAKAFIVHVYCNVLLLPSLTVLVVRNLSHERMESETSSSECIQQCYISGLRSPTKIHDTYYSHCTYWHVITDETAQMVIGRVLSYFRVAGASILRMILQFEGDQHEGTEIIFMIFKMRPDDFLYPCSTPCPDYSTVETRFFIKGGIARQHSHAADRFPGHSPHYATSVSYMSPLG